MSRTRSNLFLLFFILFLLFGNALRGQQVRLYTSADGLPNSKINRVYQDPRGIVWVATQNGLSYFDGMHFTSFRNDPDRPGSLNSNLVTAVFTDSRGTCWIGTSIGVQIFDHEFHTFTDFPLGNQDGYYVSSIGETPDGLKIVIATSGLGFRVFDAVTHAPDKETTDRLNRAIRGKFSGKAYIEDSGLMWMYSERGLCRIDPVAGTAQSGLWGSARERIPEGIAVSTVRREPRSGKVLIGTFNHGLFLYDPALDYIRPARGNGAGNDRIRDILVLKPDDPSGDPQVWIGTEESGIRRFDLSTEAIEEADIRRSPIDPTQCKVHTLIQDSQGNVWAGVFQKGLLVIPRSVYGFDYYALTADGKPRGENLSGVTSVVRDRTGSLWVGTDGGGLFRLNEDGTTRRFTRDNTPALHNNSIMSLALDGRGKLWISTYMGGIVTWAPEEGFRRFSPETALFKAVAAIYDPARDRILYGTHGRGVVSVSLPEGRVERFSESHTQDYVSSLCLDSSNRLWVGAIDGVRCYDAATGHIDERRSVERKNSSDILQGADGVLWIGSADGLIRLDPDTNEQTLYTRRDGLPSNMIYIIRQDDRGVLWLGTGYGLSRFDPQTGVFRNFYAYDGLQDNEFQNRAGYRDADGQLFFGGINGLTAFYPERVEAGEQTLGGVYFSRLTVLGQTVEHDFRAEKHNILDRPIDRARQITLRKSQNVFSLDFSVLEYTNPQKVVYGYRMEGFDTGWNYTDASQRSATYTNLPDGRYRFRIKAFYDGETDPGRAAYNQIVVRVLPPWYKTGWARLVYATLFAAAAGLFARFLNRRRMRRRERQEMERKEMKLQMFADLSHEIRTPLMLVISPLKALRESEAEPRRKNLYELIHRNAMRILMVVNQLIDINRIDNRQYVLRFGRVDMICFLDDLMRSFEQLAVARNIDYRIVSGHESLDVWIDRSHFDKVIFNILSNAFKFTPDDGSVLVALNIYLNNRQSGIAADVPQFLEMRIENSGSHIPAAEQDRIFERFYQTDGSRSGGSGIGLYLARRIVELHGGSLKAENTEDGVVFILRIPLGESHLSQEMKAADPDQMPCYTIRADAVLPSPAEYHKLSDNSAPNEAEKETESENTPSRTVYFVDDDPDLLKYLKLELSGSYRVETFPNGKEAWERIVAKVPDAVVTDLAMPETDGIALCRKIRECQKTDHLPVIVFTAKAAEESERLCLENGADRYLIKPVSLELLKGTIVQAIRIRETLRNKYSIPAAGDDEQQIDSPDSRFVARVIRCIRQNIENPEFSVDELSRQVGISRVHLNRKLKENLNLSPSNLIRSIRLRQAASLLVRRQCNISEAAYKVGFSAPTSFSNSFKEYFGLSPTEYVAKNADHEPLGREFEID